MWDKIRKIDSNLGSVSKYVFEKADAVAEAVLYKYPDYKTRTVICCSTQSGCPIGCRFCGAGDRFVRSLTASEIIAQVTRTIEDTGTNPQEMDRLQIMFMSMGEPLLNQKELILTLQQLYASYPRAALLVSTSAPRVDYAQITQASMEIPTVGLQFSIHESTDAKRDELIPFKAKFTLEEIANQGEQWFRATGRQPFFNYCAHAENSSAEDANRLYKLFDPRIWQATISVICERDEHVAAANARQRQLAEDFMAHLGALGYSTRCFDPAGQDDIGGGCGQLWFIQDWMKQNEKKSRPSVGYSLPVIHTPR